MAALIYSLCTLTALMCAALLLRAHAQTRSRFLLWSGVCFAFLTLNNLIVVIDELVLPMRDLSPWRVGTGLLGISVLLYGLIFEER